MAAIERRWPDVLVSDIGMPGEDGYDLIRRVRRLEAVHGRHLPAIALTAYAAAEDRCRTLHLATTPTWPSRSKPPRSRP